MVRVEDVGLGYWRLSISELGDVNNLDYIGSIEDKSDLMVEMRWISKLTTLNP